MSPFFLYFTVFSEFTELQHLDCACHSVRSGCSPHAGDVVHQPPPEVLHLGVHGGLGAGAGLHQPGINQPLGTGTPALALDLRIVTLRQALVEVGLIVGAAHGHHPPRAPTVGVLHPDLFGVL